MITIKEEIVSRLATDHRIWHYQASKNDLKTAQECIRAYEETVSWMLWILDIPIPENKYQEYVVE